MLTPDRVLGLNDLMPDAVKFLSQLLTASQLEGPRANPEIARLPHKYLVRRARRPAELTGRRIFDQVAHPSRGTHMLRRMLWRMLALAVLAAGAVPARAAEAYQVSTISSLLAGGYDGDTTVGEMLRHGDFGLGTFNGVDGEMIVLDGQTYRATTDGLPRPRSRRDSRWTSSRARSTRCHTAPRAFSQRGWTPGSRRSRSAASPSKTRPTATWWR